MITIISTNLPRRVRGVLKIWLLEIKAGVFVGDINKNIEARIVDFLRKYMNEKYELIIVRNNSITPQGFEVNSYKSTNLILYSGQTFTKKVVDGVETLDYLLR